jgi:uncharacterized protein DUF4390
VRPTRFVIRLAGALAAAALLAPSARALDIAVGFPRALDGNTVVDVRMSRPFSSRIRETLSRAMPATLLLHVELWRARSGWFDRLENGYDVLVRLRYDIAHDDYRIERRGMPPVAAPTLDSLEARLEAPFALPVARLDRIQPGHRYYVVIGVTLRPVSIEDAEEIDDVIFPEASKGGPGLGIITGVPRAIFDAVRNIAGLGDLRARAISQTFEAEDLGRR